MVGRMRQSVEGYDLDRGSALYRGGPLLGLEDPVRAFHFVSQLRALGDAVMRIQIHGVPFCNGTTSTNAGVEIVLVPLLRLSERYLCLP